MTTDRTNIAPPAPSTPVDSPASNISARSLFVLLSYPTTLQRHCRVLEDAMSGLLVCALQDTAGMGTALFGSDPASKWWYTTGVDITATASDVTRLVMAEAQTIIEVKFDAPFNDTATGTQLARYGRDSPAAQAFVVMPKWRIENGGIDTVHANFATGRPWTIVTWEAIRDWLGEYLGEHVSDDPDNPIFQVMATMARIRD